MVPSKSSVYFDLYSESFSSIWEMDLSASMTFETDKHWIGPHHWQGIKCVVGTGEDQ